MRQIKLIYIFYLTLGVLLTAISSYAGVNEFQLDDDKNSQSLTKNNTILIQSNPNLEITSYLNGITSIVVITSDRTESLFDFDDEFYGKYYKLIKSYLNFLGAEHIAITVDEQNWVESNISLENIALFELKIDHLKNYISKISFLIKSCNQDEFLFEKEIDYNLSTNWDETLLFNLKEMYSSSIKYHPNSSLKLKREITEWNQSTLEEYLSDNSLEPLEGIYERYLASKDDSKYKIGVVKENDSYNIIYLDGGNGKNWTEGELKGEIGKTSIKDFYKVNWRMSDKTENENVYLTVKNENFLEFDFLEDEYSSKTRYLKMFPYKSNINTFSSSHKSSGTGFLIGDNGLVVTNHHIINNDENIIVEFKNKSGSKKYRAQKFIDDKENDITLLKIIDEKFNVNNGFGYDVNIDESQLGTDVFTLGFPMIETMGESIKLSDGIISCESGYMSDSTNYQITVPVNPGNSGGPLFDKKGNLVGIVNARYSGAENVSYAIKAKYLIQLLKNNNVKLNSDPLNSLFNLPFVEQVEKINDIVCLIKVY